MERLLPHVGQTIIEARAIAPLLTSREREVLILLAHGRSNKLIARALDISVRTVETHRFSLRRKLGIDTVAGLVKYAIKKGWTTASA